MKMSHHLITFSISLCWVCSAYSAAIVPVSYDFGSGVGQDDIASSGFSTHTEPTTDVTFSDQPNAIRVENPSTVNGSVDLGMLHQTFTGMGPGETNDFRISTEFNSEGGVPFVQRVGIHLFSDSAASRPDRSGIAAFVQASSGNSQTLILSNRGMDPGLEIVQSAPFSGDFYDTSSNPTQLQVDGYFGTYAGGNNLRLYFTVINGSDSESIFADFNTTSFPVAETGFGVSVNGDDTSIFDIGSFELEAIPEPSTLMLVGFTFLGLMVRQRRKR